MNRSTVLLVATVLALGMALAVSACGGDDENGGTSAATETTEATATEATETETGGAAGTGGQKKQGGGAGNTSTVDLDNPGEVKELCRQLPDACTYYPDK